MNSLLTSIRIVMVGPIGAGKGTVCEFITKEFQNFVHISPGILMQREIQNNTLLGRQVKEYVSNGLLIPDELIVGHMLQTIEKVKTKHWLLDGFPRTVDQAKMLHGLLDLQKRPAKRSCVCDEKGLIENPITAVFYVHAPESVIIERLSHRYVHVSSGRTYNIGYNEPRVKWKDNETGEDLVRREDDRLEIIQIRFKTFRSVTMQVIDFYREYNIPVLDLDSSQPNILPTVKQFIDEEFQKFAKMK